jgi:hypothetical protein
LISGVFFCLKLAQPFSEGRFFFAGARFSNKYNRRTQREDFEHPRAFLRSKGRSFFAIGVFILPSVRRELINPVPGKQVYQKSR